MAKATAESAFDTLDGIIDAMQGLQNDDAAVTVQLAALTLRDLSGRDLRTALQNMCIEWGVRRQEKIQGRWKNRPVAEVAKEIRAALARAAQGLVSGTTGLTREARLERSGVKPHAATSSHISPESTQPSQSNGAKAHAAADVDSTLGDDEPPEKKPKIQSLEDDEERSDAQSLTRKRKPLDDDDPEQLETHRQRQGASSDHIKQTASWSSTDLSQMRVQPLDLKPYEVGSIVLHLKRIQKDLFEATLADGSVVQIDSVMIHTLPQGMAKLATLQMLELQAAKAKANQRSNKTTSAAPPRAENSKPVNAEDPLGILKLLGRNSCVSCVMEHSHQTGTAKKTRVGSTASPAAPVVPEIKAAKAKANERRTSHG